MMMLTSCEDRGSLVPSKLLRALVSKAALREIEVLAILDSAAESAEKAPDKLGGMYSQSIGRHIRNLMEAFQKPEKSDVPERKH